MIEVNKTYDLLPGIDQQAYLEYGKRAFATMLKAPGSTKESAMGYFTSLITILVVLVLVCLTFPRPAYAYLDPGTGSYILQLIMAGLLGAAFAVKLFWKDIRIFFKNLFSGEEEHEETEE